MKKTITALVFLVIFSLFNDNPSYASPKLCYDHSIFEVMVSGGSGEYEVTGKVHSNKPIFYTVEDGHNEFITHKRLSIKEEKFHLNIKINKKMLPENGTVILYLQEKGTAPYPIVLEVIG